MTGRDLAYLRVFVDCNWDYLYRNSSYREHLEKEADQLYSTDPNYWDATAKKVTENCLKYNIELK